MGSQIHTFATFEHLWPDGSVAVSVHHEQIGWLEFDVPAIGLPRGIRPRDGFEVRLRLDAKGNVISHQIPPGARIVRSKPSVGAHLSARIPAPPNDWDN